MRLSSFNNSGTAAGIRRGQAHIRQLNEQHRANELACKFPAGTPVYYYRPNGEVIPAQVIRLSQTGLAVRIEGDFPEGTNKVWVSTRNIERQEDRP